MIKVTRIAILILLSTSLVAYSQDISYVKGGVVSYEGKKLNKPKDILSVLKNHESEALLQSFNKYKTNRTGSNVFSAIGGFGVGWSLGDLIGGRKPNNAVLASSVGAIGVALIFNHVSNKHLQEAVTIYNQNAGSVSVGVDTFNNGLGISIKI